MNNHINGRSILRPFFIFSLAFASILLLLATPQLANAQCTVTQLTFTTAGENKEPDINANATNIAFQSTSDLTGGNPDGNSEIFLWTQGNVPPITQITNTTVGQSTISSVNIDATIVAFQSTADFTGANPDGNSEIFLWTQGNVPPITQITNTSGAGVFNSFPTLSSAGNRIAFESNADFTGQNPDGNNEIFLWDSTTGISQITNTSGPGVVNLAPTIDADGTVIAFESNADILGTNPDGNFEIYRWTEGALPPFLQITNSTFGDNLDPSTNSDGSRIAWESTADLTGENPDGNNEIFHWSEGVIPPILQITSDDNVNSFLPSLNADGARMAFYSDAHISVTSDSNFEIFRWDILTGLIKITRDKKKQGNSILPSIDASGNNIAFQSDSDVTGVNPDLNNEIFITRCTGDVGAQVDLSITKTHVPEFPEVGVPFDYSIFITNFGLTTATGVVFRDTLPEGFVFNSATTADAPSPCTNDHELVTCGMYNLPVGELQSITINVTPTLTGTDANLVNVQSIESDLNTSNNFDTDVTTVVDSIEPPPVISADLTITKTASSEPVILGDDVVYTLIVSNFGPDDATNAIVDDVLPASFSLVSVSSSQGGCTALPCNLGTLTAGQIEFVTLTATPSELGIFINTAQVSADQQDPNGTNNVGATVTTVEETPIIGPPQAELYVVQSDFPDPVQVNDTLTYTVFISNIGPANADNVVLKDTIASTAAFVSATADSGAPCSHVNSLITCNITQIPSGDTERVVIKVTPTVTGTIANKAEVSADENDPQAFSNVSIETTTVIDTAPPVIITGADIAITKSDSPDPVVVDNELTYILVATNNGPEQATGVVVTDTLLDNTTFVSATSDQTTCTHDTGVVTCNLGVLTPGDISQTVIVVKPTVTGAITNIARIVGNEDDPETSNNLVSQVTTVSPKSIVPPPGGGGGGGETPPSTDLFVIKSGSPDPTIAGETLTYSVLIGNNGPQQATNVTMTDTLPPGVDFVSVKTSRGSCSESGGTVICEIGNINTVSQESLLTSVDITVRPQANGAIANYAQISGGQVDPNTSNNISLITTNVVGGGDPRPGPPGGGGGGGSGGGSKSCSLASAPVPLPQTAANLALLLIPVLFIVIRARRYRK